MYPNKAIQQTDELLQQHEVFGQSSRIVVRVVERYKFALGALSAQSERLGALSRRVEGLDGASAEALFGAPLVRAELDVAIGGLGTPGVRLEPLCLRLEGGLAPSRPGAGPGASRRGYSFSVGPDRRARVWRALGASNRAPDGRPGGVVDEGAWGAEGLANAAPLAPHVIERLERACSLLRRLVPRTAESALRHLDGVAVVESSGRALSGLEGDDAVRGPAVDLAELDDLWRTARALARAGFADKLADLTRLNPFVADDGPVEVPWGGERSLSSCVKAYYVRAHLHAFRAAVKRLGPALYGEYGRPHDDETPPSASPRGGAFAALGPGERLRSLYERLEGAWAPRLTLYGRALVAWLWGAVGAGPLAPAPREVGRRASAPAGPSSLRYRQNRNLTLRNSPAAGALFALNHDTGRIMTLYLAARLAFELCNGKTERHLCSSYAALTGLKADRAWGQLGPLLDELAAGGLIEPTSGVGPAFDETLS